MRGELEIGLLLMEINMLSRREFLNFSAATIALTSLPNQIQSNQLIRNYKLTAEITPHFFDKKGVLDSLWLYNKQSPGPVIEAKENDIIRVEFVNNLIRCYFDFSRSLI